MRSDSRARAAFTLIELLVVVAIIALLVAILTSSIAHAKASAWRVRCAANQKQLMTAVLIYVNDYRDTMPMPNWASQDPALGWLYQGPIRPKKFEPWHRETGSIWRYLTEAGVYHCPKHDPPHEKSAKVTSYLMNGAIAGYGRERWSFQVPKFRVEALVFWEAEETGWNDGSSYPTEGLTKRHGKGATVVGIDGHTEWMTHDQYLQEMQKPIAGKLWCNPGTSDGR
ncbi:MAG: hypothetical protein CHACPFDD_00099 [Phycisphaerae bacterium]|nr:hypothetical protein [Phycisphaerae bacterium]